MLLRADASAPHLDSLPECGKRDDDAGNPGAHYGNAPQPEVLEFRILKLVTNAGHWSIYYIYIYCCSFTMHIQDKQVRPTSVLGPWHPAGRQHVLLTTCRFNVLTFLGYSKH